MMSSWEFPPSHILFTSPQRNVLPHKGKQDQIGREGSLKGVLGGVVCIHTLLLHVNIPLPLHVKYTYTSHVEGKGKEDKNKFI